MLRVGGEGHLNVVGLKVEGEGQLGHGDDVGTEVIGTNNGESHGGLLEVREGEEGGYEEEVSSFINLDTLQAPRIVTS